MITRPKIAVVVPKYGLVGGGERFVLELTERLAQTSRFDLHVFAQAWQGATKSALTFHRLSVIPFPKWLTPLSFAWSASRAIAAAGDFSLIHAHERILRADICSQHFVPHRFWVREIRGKRVLSLFDLATCWLERRMLAGPTPCRAVLPVSSLAKACLLRSYPLPGALVETVHPGVDGAFFKPREEGAREGLRLELGLAKDDVVILFVAMNFELKGLDLLLEAVSRMKKKAWGQRVKVLVVGKGRERKFKQLAGELGIGDAVCFAGVRRDMASIYQAGDLLVLLSGFDTFGMVVAEAMAAALPVIVSSQVGARDLVREAENGFVVERLDRKQVDAALWGCLGDQTRYRSMQASARKTAQALSWEAVAARVAAIYEQLLALPPSNRPGQQNS